MHAWTAKDDDKNSDRQCKCGKTFATKHADYPISIMMISLHPIEWSIMISQKEDKEGFTYMFMASPMKYTKSFTVSGTFGHAYFNLKWLIKVPGLPKLIHNAKSIDEMQSQLELLLSFC